MKLALLITVVVAAVIVFLALLALTNLWGLICELADSDIYPGQKPAIITKWAKRIKYLLQALIGFFIVMMVLVSVTLTIFDPVNHGSIQILAWVGKALLFAAAIDLAFMLFTPGPDEALQPVIIGIAATVLILVSDFKEAIGEMADHKSILNSHLIWPVVSVFILVCAITLLFYVRQRYGGSREKRNEFANDTNTGDATTAWSVSGWAEPSLPRVFTTTLKSGHFTGKCLYPVRRPISPVRINFEPVGPDIASVPTRADG